MIQAYLEMVNVDLLTKLTDNMLTLGVLGAGMWVMWKRDERYRAKQEKKLDDMEARLNNYNDNLQKQLFEMQERSMAIQQETNLVLHESSIALKANNRIITNFTDEMKDFRDSELYQIHINTKR